jgi:hypothetical protein
MKLTNKDFFKLFLVLLAIVVIQVIISDWSNFKAGLFGGIGMLE